MLPSALLRKEIYPMLEKFFKPLGWKYTKMPHRFEYRDDKWVFTLGWSFTAPIVYDYGTLHKDVDVLKRELKLHIPGLNPIIYSTEGYDKFTLADRRCAQTYAPNGPQLPPSNTRYAELVKSRYAQPLNSLYDLDKWIDSIYKYISGTGLDYIEEYKYLPNLLRLLDEDYLESYEMGHPLASGGFRRFTDFMLIAKLCSDNKITAKIKYVEDNLLNPEYPKYEGDEKYWDDFLKILDSVSARYPHYSKLSEEDLRKYNPPLFKRRLE